MEFMVWSRYVNIDDCWANWNRTADGKLAPNSTRFPSGMKALANYVESKGLKLGTCKLAPCVCGRHCMAARYHCRSLLDLLVVPA
jgi:hypothetical protein